MVLEKNRLIRVNSFMIKVENNHSNHVALEGFSEGKIETIYHLLQKVRKNIEKDWEFVKKGNKRKY